MRCSTIASRAAALPRSKTRADAPLEDALALIVRERLTGRKPPKSAQKIVDLWRPWIEERASADLDRLGQSIEDQRAFADCRPQAA